MNTAGVSYLMPAGCTCRVSMSAAGPLGAGLQRWADPKCPATHADTAVGTLVNAPVLFAAGPILTMIPAAAPRCLYDTDGDGNCPQHPLGCPSASVFVPITFPPNE